MPYGLPRDKDTPENNKKMESCVTKVMKGNSKLDKSAAVAICKKSMGFMIKGGRDDGEPIYIIPIN